MNKTFATIVLVCVFLAVIGLVVVYWVKYRPEEIRALCYEEGTMKRPQRTGEKFYRRTRTYQECLKEYGLDK